jgi:putative ATPase
LKLKALGRGELVQLARRGMDKLGLSFPEEVLEFLAALANGDARALLNLVEYVSGLPEEQRSLEGVQKVMPEIVARHDKDGDSHYELASAMIKSIRGSDPDAALYYLACLLEGGEDPRFICRRLILSASEDVGLADPQALTLAVSCQQAVEFVGMPEGYIPLSETVVYLALAPKSNSTYAAYHNVTREIKNNGMQPVPLHLRNAVTKMQKQWGYGKDYQYAHDTEEKLTDMECLPESLAGRVYYRPTDQGSEVRAREKLERVKAWKEERRRAQKKRKGRDYGKARLLVHGA